MFELVDGMRSIAETCAGVKPREPILIIPDIGQSMLCGREQNKEGDITAFANRRSQPVKFHKKHGAIGGEEI